MTFAPFALKRVLLAASTYWVMLLQFVFVLRCNSYVAFKPAAQQTKPSSTNNKHVYTTFRIYVCDCCGVGNKERVIWSCLVDDDVFLDNYDFMQLLNVDRRRMQWLHGSFTWHSWRRVLAQWRRLREQRALAAQQRVNASGVQHRTWQDDPYLSDSS